MSNQALTWAYGLTLGSATQKAVLIFLAHKAHDDSMAWPSVREIMDATELKERTVRKALAALEARGLISRGDQRHAVLGLHGTIIPADRRATVWNLAMDRNGEVGR